MTKESIFIKDRWSQHIFIFLFEKIKRGESDRARRRIRSFPSR